MDRDNVSTNFNANIIFRRSKSYLRGMPGTKYMPAIIYYVMIFKRLTHPVTDYVFVSSQNAVNMWLHGVLNSYNLLQTRYLIQINVVCYE